MNENTPRLQSIIKKEILKMMSRDGWFINNRLPSEKQLAEKFQVSRGTIRSVLSDLENEGKVRRLHGSGTYIHPKASTMQATLFPKTYFHDIIEINGYNCTVRCEGIKELISNEIAKQMCLKEATSLMCTQYLFLADGTPAIFCENHVKTELFSEEASTYIRENPSALFFDVLKKFTNIDLTWTIMQFGANNNEVFMRYKNLYKELKPPENILYFETISHDNMNAPLLFSKVSIDTRLLDIYLIQNKYPETENEL